MMQKAKARTPYDWPRGMRAAQAAEYIGLSESTFLAEVKKGTIPEPTWLTANRKVWLREKLDEYLDRKAGNLGDDRPWEERLQAFR